MVYVLAEARVKIGNVEDRGTLDVENLGIALVAHDLCAAIPAERKQHYLQPAVGHYGIFNGRKWRGFIQPKIADFIERMS